MDVSHQGALIRFYSAGSSLTDTDRATFDRVLASFRFGG
jgi:hypothetical protein